MKLGFNRQIFEKKKQDYKISRR